MKKFFVLIFSLSFIISCGKNLQTKPADENAQPSGTREFNIDEGQSAFKIFLSGVFMGTPDSEAVWSVIEDAQSSGLIDQSVQLATPIEGGISQCIQVLDAEHRIQIIDQLKLAETSLQESHYSIQSVADCAH